MSANEKQVGGDHYRSEYQHWDWAVDLLIGPLEYGATRYLTRHKKKNGAIDLQKAAHFVSKIYDLAKSNSSDYKKYNMLRENYRKDLDIYLIMDRFAKANNLSYLETMICYKLATWNSHHELLQIIGLIEKLEQFTYAKPSDTTTAAPATMPPIGRALATGAALDKAVTVQREVTAARQGNTEHPAPFGYDGDNE